MAKREIYYLNVKDVEESEDPLIQKVDEFELKAVVDIVSAKCGGGIDIDEIRIDPLTRKALKKLFLRTSVNVELINNVMLNFYKELKTTQKEKDKYIFIFKIKDRIIIAHCRGEKGIVRTR